MNSGAVAELIAANYLRARGLSLLTKNYRCRLGEIDLIMRQHRPELCLVFVEVRYRRGESHGGAAASIDPAKQRRLSLAAGHYLSHHREWQVAPCRFDVLTLSGQLWQPKLQWLRAAFDVA